jgi:hypothetical protein
LAAQQPVLAAQVACFLAAQQPFLAWCFLAAQQPFLAPQQPFLPAQVVLGAHDAAAQPANAGAAAIAAAATKDAPTMFFKDAERELVFMGVSEDGKAPVAWQKSSLKRYDGSVAWRQYKLTHLPKYIRSGCSAGCAKAPRLVSECYCLHSLLRNVLEG